MEGLSPGPYLLCHVGGDRLAIAASDVREVLPLLPVWRPPTLPSPLAGFVSVEGATLPVLSLAALFGAGATGEVDVFAHLVRPRNADGGHPCLLVDRADDIVMPEPEALRAVSSDASQNGAIVAEVMLADGVAHVLSLDQLLIESERARIAALTEDAARRAAEWSPAEPA